MDDAALLAVLDEAATSVRTTLDGLDDWGLAGTRPGQHRSDLAADVAACAVLDAAGLGVLSEESGTHGADRELVAVLDPLDGSTNAARGIPWYATSLCVLDGHGPLVALVVNQASGERFEAVRGGGARLDGEAVAPSTCERLGDAAVGLLGYCPRHLGWRKYRAFGAAALDLCAVACGRLDAYIDLSAKGQALWDYMGALLVCREAGAEMVDLEGRDLVICDAEQRRVPVAAASARLLDEAVAARRSVRPPR